jgi:ABC-2 type transport system ATP-binding protein
MDAIVETSGLIQGYGRKLVIDGLDIRIGRGAVGLLGPNGSGKTTLLRTLATVVPPRGGLLTISGQRIDSERAALSVRRGIGYLPQDTGYFPGFTVYDFVYYCAWVRQVNSTSIHSAVSDAISAVGLADQARRKMKTLSGGMARRAGIASAIVGSPRLLLLDEPTVGLDPKQRMEFRSLIRSIQHTAAVVLSTHLVEDVVAISDDLAVMAHGTLLFRGRPSDLADMASGTAGDSAFEQGYVSLLDRHEVPA